MALAKAYSVSLLGLAGTIIEVEADISSALPNFVLVGLPDASLSEATSRVRAACANSGLPFPSKKITVNLSPASVPKSGSSFDLAIAVAVIAAQGSKPKTGLERTVYIGELGLDGGLKAVSGVIPMLMIAKKNGFSRAVVPLQNLPEASLTGGMEILGCSRLGDLFSSEGSVLQPFENVDHEFVPRSRGIELELSDVTGQDLAVKALQVAAVGGHHISLIGTPGSGKTMLAERLIGILPDLSPEDALEVTAIESLSAGNLGQIRSLDLRPRFQNPHHTASTSAIVGGGQRLPRPGAASLAHRGVLFLDEALEFQTPALESLREPLESGQIAIHRSAGSAVFPADFQLVLAANPCSCGNFGSVKKSCICSFTARRRYLSRLSGPLLDRIDIRLKIEPVSLLERRVEQASMRATPKTSETRALIAEARQFPAKRLSRFGLGSNSKVPGEILRKQLQLPRAHVRDLERLLDKGGISMRGFDRCLRLAWSISDLEGREAPSKADVELALAMRGTDSLEELA